ncbi:MAG: methionine adenosyltransferase [Candidatus Shapirobacteria bacterium]|nr:methionine adenosyltransferase [Candidatus Shapirobacteria bacterium]
MNYPLFVSESVCAGHPDKICDQISDAVLDAALTVDKNCRVALETLVTTNKIVMAGEVTCNQSLDYVEIAKKIIKEIGYTDPVLNFDENANIEVLVHQQSKDIAVGADNDGAGDQGMMFGYACNETPQLMPLPIVLSHELCRKMDELQFGELNYLRPDGKAEVSVGYENSKVIKIEKIVLAKPFDPAVDKEKMKNDLYNLAILPILEKYNLNKVAKEEIVVNGTGVWEIGGPASDTGVTGRKIVVDTYGGMGRIGGGCFSGKDPTKVDRSGAYAARYIAKNIVAAGLADRCEVQLAYVIGVKDPIGKSIECFGSEKKDLKTINDFAWNLLDLSVKGIIDFLDLKRPIYGKTARYGHFGYEEYPWERIV